MTFKRKIKSNLPITDIKSFFRSGNNDDDGAYVSIGNIVSAFKLVEFVQSHSEASVFIVSAKLFDDLIVSAQYVFLWRDLADVVFRPFIDFQQFAKNDELCFDALRH